MKIFAHLLPVIAALLCGCAAGGVAPAGEECARKIGVLLPSSGVAAADARDGITLAAELRGAGQPPDKRFEVFFADSSGGLRAQLKTISGMASRGVRVFCAGFDREIVPSHEILSGMGGVFFNFLIEYPPATLLGKNSTRIFFNSAQECEMLAARVNSLKDAPKTFAIISEDSPAGKPAGDFMSFLLSAPDRKVFREYFSKGESGFDIFARHIVVQNPRAIFYSGTGEEFPALSSALSRAGFSGAILRGRGLAGDISAGGASVPALSAFETRAASPEARLFREKFRARFGREAGVYAAWGFDGANALMDAMEESGFKVSCMRGKFANSRRRGVLGVLKFDSSADCVAELELSE